jgi:uncharacterized protein DUF4394
MRIRTLLLAVVALSLAAASPAYAATFIGLTGDNGIFQFDSASPGSPGPFMPITGLQSGETVQGIDFRPANGQLYGVGSSNTLYTINTATGAATPVGPLGMSLSGNSFGVDFNPAADRLRIVSDADQNLVVDPATGMASAGPPLTYGGMSNPNIVAIADSMALFGIDATTDYLVVIDPATGMVTNRGPLGVSPGPLVGFDIVDGTGYFAAGPFFHLVNLTTGNAPSAGMFPNPLFVKGLAAVPAPGGGPGPGPGGETPVGGDFDLDGDVDLNDLTKLLSAFGGDGVTIRVETPGGVVEGESMTLLTELLANFGRGAGASQRGRRKQTVIARRRTTLRAGDRKRVRVPLTRAGRRLYRGYTRKRLRATLRVAVTYRPLGRPVQKRTFKRKVTLRVKRPRR